MSLHDELAAKCTDSIRIARANYYCAYFLLGVAVVASAAASIAVAADLDWKNATKATLAALPGIVVLVMTTFRFDARAQWWWARHHAMDALRRELEYEARSPADVNKDLTAFIKEHDGRWPGFGNPPGR
jgi:hypothetical protein